MNKEEILKNQSRRKMIRDSAIAATGAVLLPSFLTSCTKDVHDIIKPHFPKGGLGAVALTPDELKAAADNLNRMRALINDLYDKIIKYDEVVFLALSSTKTHPNWTNFIVNVIIDIATAATAAAAVAGGVPLAVPAIACLSAFLHDWGIGKNTPPDLAPLTGFFAGFQDGQLKMQDALDKHLGFLTEVTDNYANLQAAWKDPIVFNNNSYTLADLAKSFFPDSTDHDVEYRKIYDPMYLHHKKSVWNLAIMKCCSYYMYRWAYDVRFDDTITSYVRRFFYPDNKGRYLRASLDQKDYPYNRFAVVYWNLGIDGYPFSEAASKILFVDDTPGHIINPDGLFSRDYVFKQFSTKKPDFSEGRELGYTENANFAGIDDWTFTGGLFPRLTQ